MSSTGSPAPASLVYLMSSETKLAKRLVPYIICSVGLAVIEGPRKKSEQLHEESVRKYFAKVNEIDIGDDDLLKKMMVSDSPREDAIPSIRKYLRDAARSAEVNPAFIWNKLGHYKSEFRNHWCPNYASIACWSFAMRTDASRAVTLYMCYVQCSTMKQMDTNVNCVEMHDFLTKTYF